MLFSKNETPIYTNNFDVKINRENVDKHFTIFQIGTNASYFNENVLDIPSEKFKAQSVAYYNRENRWFAMFNKGEVSFKEFRAAIQQKDDSSIVNEVDLFNKDTDGKKGIKDIELLQLLANSLKNRRSDLFSYNNITGQLYYPFERKKNAKVLEFLHLRFYNHDENKIALEADTVTFSDYNTRVYYHKDAKKKYVFDDKTGELRKALQSDFDKKCRFFDKGDISRYGKRTIFLDFSSNDSFLNSKVGIIAKFLNDIKENLSDFVQISQIPLYEYNSYDKPLTDYENNDYSQFLKNKGVCVVDTVKTTESKAMRKDICDFLKSEYGINEIPEKRKHGMYIIEIIHSKDSEFYEYKEPVLFEKLSDQHNCFTEDEIIQHITVENFEIKNIIMNKIAQELIIKGDIYDSQISLVNWNEKSEWNFVCCGDGIWNEQKRCYQYTYYKMSISPSGKIKIDTFSSKESPSGDWGVIDKIFREYNKNGRKKNSFVECIIYKDINEINLIYETRQFTLPNIEEIAKERALSDGTINKDVLKSYIEEFSKQRDLSEYEKETLDKISKNIESSFCNDISYRDIFSYEEDGKKKSLYRKSISKEFVDWVYCTKGILLHDRLRGENACKNFNSFLGIKTTELGGKFKYFVGKKNKEAIKRSIASSCKIRDVISWNKNGENPSGKIFFDDFAHMLCVEFVRNEQYTVLPFPIKYLKEYIRSETAREL